MRVDLSPEALWIGALCGIWANCKSILLARRRRADRVRRAHREMLYVLYRKESLQAPLAGTFTVYHPYPSGMGRL